MLHHAGGSPRQPPLTRWPVTLNNDPVWSDFLGSIWGPPPQSCHLVPEFLRLLLSEWLNAC